MRDTVTLNVNGKDYEFMIGDKMGQIPTNELLVNTIRERLGLTGTKLSCGEGCCGACAVLIDDKAEASCVTLTVECEGKKIVTIEGLADPVTGKLDPIQQAIFDYSAFQCGFCTPGIVIAARALFIRNPNPTEEDISEALSGNLCRCISQYRVLEAISSINGKEE
ncbi:(2Fe-2S)-binding protein [Tannockella kyphosi]|uniref:(2Fe-2S)-binding protein n=1 Tax=Tannockella kyphosi TaxID=2899121 RepID=UPI0020133DBC|nr:(2Fe-2S)-binding protein [Tannockella kyphosi]